MKCPKCGYVSFNHLDQCKKCGKDLVLFKEQKHIWGIRPGKLKFYPLPSEVSAFESMESISLPAEEEMKSTLATVAADKPGPILEESAQEIETIEFPSEEHEELIEPLEVPEEIGEEAVLAFDDEKEIVLEEEPVGLDISFAPDEGEDAKILDLDVSAESDEGSGPLLLLEESEQDIQLDLEDEEEPPMLPLEEHDEAEEGPLILLQEKDQPEEEIILGLEDSTDELELSLEEDEEEETK